MLTLSLSLSQKYHWQIDYTFKAAKEKKKDKDKGQDTSCPGSDLQSLGSLIFDKNSVNREAKEPQARAYPSVQDRQGIYSCLSHSLWIYSSWRNFPALIITGIEIDTSLLQICFYTEPRVAQALDFLW